MLRVLFSIVMPVFATPVAAKKSDWSKSASPQTRGCHCWMSLLFSDFSFLAATTFLVSSVKSLALPEHTSTDRKVERLLDHS